MKYPAFAAWFEQQFDRLGIEKEADMARRIGVAESMVNRWRAGATLPAPDSCQKIAAGDGWRETGLVFTRPDGAAVSPAAFNHWFIRVRARAGLPTVRPHDLRHTFISALASQGVSQRAAMEAAGHASSAITVDLYTHASEEDLARVAEAIDRAFAAS